MERVDCDKECHSSSHRRKRGKKSKSKKVSDDRTHIPLNNKPAKAKRTKNVPTSPQKAQEGVRSPKREKHSDESPKVSRRKRQSRTPEPMSSRPRTDGARCADLDEICSMLAGILVQTSAETDCASSVAGEAREFARGSYSEWTGTPVAKSLEVVTLDEVDSREVFCEDRPPGEQMQRELEIPEFHPPLNDEEWEEVREHHSWLKGLVRVLYSRLPENLKAGCQGSPAVLDDSFSRASTRIASVFFLDMDYDELCDSSDGEYYDQDDEEEYAMSGIVKIDHGFMRTMKNRWQRCRLLSHLPTLNLFFAIFENIFLIGKSLHIVLHKNHVVDVVDMMQYNPKLNSRLHEWPTHSATMSKKRTAFPLHKKLDDFAKTIYCMQYIKDRVLPWVCDESRFATFNQVLLRLKRLIIDNVLKESCLEKLFETIGHGDSSEPPPMEAEKAVRFLNELLEMRKEINPTVGNSRMLWEMLFEQFNLIPTISKFLNGSDLSLRRATCDLCIHFTDDECRRQLHNRPDLQSIFLTCALSMWASTDCEEVCALQMQACLPIITMYSNQESTQDFYDICNSLASRWTGLFSSLTASLGDAPAPRPGYVFGQVLPTVSVVIAFFEMVSLTMQHHHRLYSDVHHDLIEQLLGFVSSLWGYATIVPKEMLISANKFLLCVINMQFQNHTETIIALDVFRHILYNFTNGNNLLSSSVLVLLRAVLQYNSDLTKNIAAMWSNPSVSPLIPAGRCEIRELFLQRLILDESQVEQEEMVDELVMLDDTLDSGEFLHEQALACLFSTAIGT